MRLKPSKSLKPLLLTAGLLCSSIGLSDAAVVVTFIQVGPDVSVSYQGTLNISALLFEENIVGTVGVGTYPSNQIVANIVPSSRTVTFYSGLSRSSASVPFVPYTPGTNSTGDDFAVGLGLDFPDGPGHLLTVPGDYISGSEISGGFTLPGQTLGSLDIDFSTVWSWGSGPSADTISYTTAAPEPSVSLLMSTLAAALFFRRR